MLNTYDGFTLFQYFGQRPFSRLYFSKVQYFSIYLYWFMVENAKASSVLCSAVRGVPV